MLRMERVIRERMTIKKQGRLPPQLLINIRLSWRRLRSSSQPARSSWTRQPLAS